MNYVRYRCLLTDYGWLEVHEDGPWYVLAGTGFAEKRIETVVTAAHGLVRRHLAVRLDPVLQAVQLPAGIADLHTTLTNVNRKTLALQYIAKYRKWLMIFSYIFKK